jgi:hypothetical protein
LLRLHATLLDYNISSSILLYACSVMRTAQRTQLDTQKHMPAFACASRSARFGSQEGLLVAIIQNCHSSANCTAAIPKKQLSILPPTFCSSFVGRNCSHTACAIGCKAFQSFCIALELPDPISRFERVAYCSVIFTRSSRISFDERQC